MLEGERAPDTIGASLSRFLDDLAIAGRSPTTLKMYGFKLRARLPLDLPVHEFTREVCRELVACEVRTRKPGTAHTFHAVLRSFGAYLEREGVMPNPMARVPKPRLEEPQTRALSKEALARLWQAACELDRGTGAGSLSRPSVMDAEAGVFVCTHRPVARPPGPEPEHTTYRLLYLLLRDTGLRRAEVAGAQWEDIEGDVLRVLGKGRKYRRVLLTPEVLGLLENSKAASTVPGESGCTAPVSTLARRYGQAFPAGTSNPTTRGPIFGLSPSRIGQLFADIARRAGVRASCHSMRHSWATEFLRSGGQMEAARILGGWSDMRMLSLRYGRSAIEDAALAEARRVSNSPRS